MTKLFRYKSSTIANQLLKTVIKFAYDDNGHIKKGYIAMKKLLLLLLPLLSTQLSAKIIEVVDPHEIVMEKTLKDKVERAKKKNKKLVIKTYDRDDEEGKHLDKLFKNDANIILYKVPYDNMKGKGNWQAQWFGDSFHDRNTVYTVYKDGKKLKRLKPAAFKTSGSLRSRIMRLYGAKKA